jgi:hypothetical protein
MKVNKDLKPAISIDDKKLNELQVLQTVALRIKITKGTFLN